MLDQFKVFSSPRESVGSYASLVATYVASFTIAQVFLKAADLGLETTDGLLKLTANEKVRPFYCSSAVIVSTTWQFHLTFDHQVDPILMGLRRVRDEAIYLGKEGVALNGTIKAIRSRIAP